MPQTYSHATWWKKNNASPILYLALNPTSPTEKTSCGPQNSFHQASSAEANSSSWQQQAEILAGNIGIYRGFTMV